MQLNTRGNCPILSLEPGWGECGWCGQCLNIARGTMGGQGEEPPVTLSPQLLRGCLASRPTCCSVLGMKGGGGSVVIHFTQQMIPATFAGERDLVPGSESFVLGAGFSLLTVGMEGGLGVDWPFFRSCLSSPTVCTSLHAASAPVSFFY